MIHFAQNPGYMGLSDWSITYQDMCWENNHAEMEFHFHELLSYAGMTIVNNKYVFPLDLQLKYISDDVKIDGRINVNVNTTVYYGFEAPTSYILSIHFTVEHSLKETNL